MKAKLAPLFVIGLVALLCSWATSGPRRVTELLAERSVDADLAPAITEVNQHFAARWRDEQLSPAAPADELLVLRRWMLSLMGTVPSLEEIRQFEADSQPQRLERWLVKLLDDRRFADYFAARLSRCFVGADPGQFIIFRRDRFDSWLSQQIREHRPYDDIVRSMVGANGLWTGQPESNFITAAFANDDLDENKLAARSARAFLGQSMDCAQCHNHFFAEWKQEQFEGLAAHFGQTEVKFGVFENTDKSFTVKDRKTLADRTVQPTVPFHEEWLPNDGTPRERLGQWITHRDNRRFERAIANRVWGLMFGKPFMAPVDDMPNPPKETQRDVLDILGADFRAHGCDLRRLIQVIALSQPFLAASQSNETDADIADRQTEAWAVFPLTRLRPEQIIGSLLQAGYVQTIDQNSHVFVRFIRFTKERDFVEAYGDLGDQELVDRAGTISQALLRMNGEITRDVIKIDPLSVSNRIANMCREDRDAIDAGFLACLTRRPTEEEIAHFTSMLTDQQHRDRGAKVEDLLWSLVNSPEFSWNH